MLDTTNPCNGYKETTVTSDSGGGSSLNLSLPGFPLPGNQLEKHQNYVKWFIKYAGMYNIDWRWLAALSWVETKWKPEYKEDIIGLFQYSQKDHNSRFNVRSDEQQTAFAALDFHTAMDKAKKNGLSNTEDQCLYAAISHNAGVAGAKWALDEANPKSISSMCNVLLNGYRQRWGVGSNKEKAEYPIKVKKAYDDICSRYSINPNKK